MSDPTLALALGGGGARGIAHVHVLAALDDLGITPIAIAGASIGSIIGAGYASGMSGEEVGEYLIQTFGNKTEILSRLWKLRPGSVRDMWPGSLSRIGQLDAEKVVRSFLPDTLPENIEDLAIPTTITGTNYYDLHSVGFTRGPLFQAMAASAAIPALFNPVVIDGKTYIDGGIVNPVPFDFLPKSADITLAVDVVGMPMGSHGVNPKRIDSVIAAGQLMMQTITKLKSEENPPTIMLRPEVSRFRIFDFLKAKAILNATQVTRDEVKRLVEQAFENHHKEQPTVEGEANNPANLRLRQG